MSYNYDKKNCDRCGISKEKRKTLPAFDTGINHPTYRYSTSFYLGFDGDVMCPECHKETELEKLFNLMDCQ